MQETGQELRAHGKRAGPGKAGAEAAAMCGPGPTEGRNWVLGPDVGIPTPKGDGMRRWGLWERTGGEEGALLIRLVVSLQERCHAAP